MPNHASAKKSLRQNETRRMRNKSRASEMKTYIKKVEQQAAAGDLVGAQDLFKIAQAKIARSAKNGLLKPNTAARKISRLNAKVKAIA